jgi:uncharacterized membrane protein
VTGMACLALASAAFVGTHFLLSHPLRQLIAGRIGEGPFRGVYSLVALVTFGLMIWVYGRMGDQSPLWRVDEVGSVVATLLMWLGAILFVGSLLGNPALPGARLERGRVPGGVFALTRHPMMWGFALWAIVHIIMVATPKALIFDGAVLFLALAGSVGQDAKKAKLMGERFHEWSAQTAFIPFSRGVANPGAVALIGGTALLLIGTWLHPFPAGPWRWIG